MRGLFKAFRKPYEAYVDVAEAVKEANAHIAKVESQRDDGFYEGFTAKVATRSGREAYVSLRVAVGLSTGRVEDLPTKEQRIVGGLLAMGYRVVGGMS